MVVGLWCPAAGGVHHALAVSLARDGQGPGLRIIVVQLDAGGLAAAQSGTEHQGEGRGIAAARRAAVGAAGIKQRPRPFSGNMYTFEESH